MICILRSDQLYLGVGSNNRGHPCGGSFNRIEGDGRCPSHGRMSFTIDLRGRYRGDLQTSTDVYDDVIRSLAITVL